MLSKGTVVFLVIIILYTLVFSLLSITRHTHFFSQGWDLGMYDQIVWQYSKGELAYSSFTQKLDLADRFRPILITIAPLYRLFTSPKTLLILQAFAIACASLPLFLLSNKETHNFMFSMSVGLGFLFFVGTQSLIMDDFHELAFLPLFFALLFYALESENWKLYWIAFFGSLLVREYVGFFMGAVGLYILLRKKPLRVGIYTVLIGVIWSIIVIFWLMPLLGQQGYKGFLGGNTGFGQESLYLLTHPLFTISHFFLPLIKIKTILISFGSFLFLPLFHIPILPIIVFQLSSRFLDLAHPYRWTPYFHYSGELAVFLAFGTLNTVIQFAQKYSAQKQKIFTVFGILLSITIGIEQVFFPVPLKLITKNDFFKNKEFMKNNQELINMIPAGVSVSTQNNLAPHLSQRNNLVLLPKIDTAEYILVDLRPEQDAFNFFGVPQETIQTQIEALINDKQYAVLAHKGDEYLLQRQ